MGIIRIGSTEDEDFVGNMSFFLHMSQIRRC